jgi:acyl-CoA hydrolase
MLTNHTKTHIVFPADCNSMGTIFGGKLLSIIDLCCFEHSLLLLKDSICDDSVTVAFNNVNFVHGAVIGDLLTVKSSVKKIGIKSLTFEFECVTMEEQVATGSCVFVARKNGIAHKHNLVKE